MLALTSLLVACGGAGTEATSPAGGSGNTGGGSSAGGGGATGSGSSGLTPYTLAGHGE